MTNTMKIIAAVVAVVAVLAVGMCSGVFKPDTSAPTYGNSQSGGGS